MTNKTKPEMVSAEDFIAALTNTAQQKDALTLLKLMQDISNEKPVMWGANMVGFGSYHYKYESGREGDWFKIGFSPRKTFLSVYITDGFPKYQEMLNKLGKHKTGKSCLNINTLADIDVNILAQILTESLAAPR